MYSYYNVVPVAIFVVYIKIFFRGPIYLQRISVFMQNLKKKKKNKKKKKKTKNMKKHVSLYFPNVTSKYIKFLFYFC